MSREELSTVTKDTKFGYDNPSLELNYKKSSTETRPNSINNTKNDGFNSVYVVSEKERGSLQDKEYEPYDHRNVSHPTTYWETLFHMLKASLGTGILAMPMAFYHAGYVVGTIGTVVIGLICTYNIHILIQSEYELCRRKKVPSMTYPQTAQAAVSYGPMCVRRLTKGIPTLCNIFLLIYQLGSCCIYVVFISSNIKDVMDQYVQKIDVRWYMAIILLPLILINWVRNLKYLAPLSTIANAVTSVSFILIFYYMFQDLPDISTLQPVAPIKTMPLFFGTVLFAMEAIGVVMPLENEMKEPQRFGSPMGVLNCAMLPITLLYTFVGFFGYLRYGPTVKGSITLDLPPDEYVAQGVRILLAFAIYVTHALALYVAYDICWREYVSPYAKNHKLIAEYVLRTVLVCITFMLAVAIPNLELFISLIGALCLSTMGLSFPALIQLFTYWYDITGTQFLLFFLKNLTIIVIAVFGFVVGTATSLDEIIKTVF